MRTAAPTGSPRDSARPTLQSSDGSRMIAFSSICEPSLMLTTRSLDGATLNAEISDAPDHRHGGPHRSRKDKPGEGAHRPGHRPAEGGEGARHLDRAWFR